MTFKTGDHVAHELADGNTMCGFVKQTFNWPPHKCEIKTPNASYWIESSKLRTATYEDTLAMSRFFANPLGN